MLVRERFVLNQGTTDQILGLKPEFGYNGFGEAVFYRTYSRTKKDGGQETWNDVVIRVINGVISIRKDHYIRNGLTWDEAFWQDYAGRMALSLFYMEWMPPGRGLWSMGTDFVYERGSMSLYNCAYTEIHDDIPEACAWIMDCLMNGVGVGFGPCRNDSIRMYPSANRPIRSVIIPDSREGWVESVRELLACFMDKNLPVPIFDYHLIRKKGLPIRGFGGLASGPEPLIRLHDQIIHVCNRYAHGEIDSVRMKTDIANMIGCCVIAGNVRRSAELACSPISDPTLLDLKDYAKHPDREEYGWMSNNSVILEKPDDFEYLGEIAQRVIKNGEPGYINSMNLPYGRLGKDDKVREDKAVGFNPCLTGETKVYTADGRGYVAIKDLADAGRDLDVFCIDEKDEVVIRRMRNPRVTGKNVRVLRIGLDDGSSIRVTENHRFMMRDRSFKEARHLVDGDSFAIIKRYLPLNAENTWWDHYVNIGYGRKSYLEHRLIKGVPGLDVDHIDGNKSNNTPENLRVLDSSVHQSSHNEGAQNSNYSLQTHEQLINKGVQLCLTLDRKFSRNEWKANGGIALCSTFRKTEFGSFYDFSVLCADLAGVQYIDLDPRTVRHYQELVEQGYDAEIIDDVVHVTKICESCSSEFTVKAVHREQGYCSLTCSNRGRDYSKNTEGLRKTYAERREGKREKQLSVYVDLKQKLGRRPDKKEWIQACRDSGVSFEISRSSSPFRSYNELIMAAALYNHKVEYVVEDGFETVYNGTVDQYHNFIVGGFEKTLKSGRKVEIGLINANCGEIPLESRETCNLVETLPTMCDSIDDWYKACEYATVYASTVSLLPTNQPSTNKIIARNRRIGVSIIDVTGWIHQFGVHKVIRWLRQGYQIVASANRWANGEAGVPEAIRKTTIKPGGTTPKLPGKTPGMSFPNFHYTLRTMRVQQDSPIFKIFHDAGYRHEPDVVSANTEVFEFPVLQGPARHAGQVSLWEQAMLLVMLQREWADNAVSNTLNFRPKWRLIDEIPEGKMYEDDDCYIVHNVYGEQKSYPLTDLIKFETKPAKYGDPEKLQIYEYDEGHEEDIIENVLSAIAPMTKSVSLLPHTAQGVYPQMPEQGITQDEYERRLAQVKPINWSEFRNSDGIDEKFCDGDNCTLNSSSH